MRSDSKNGGQYLRVAQGTQSFSRGLHGELPADSVAFMSPVRRIEQRAGGVRVVSARGTYDATRVVVSVPTPLYKEIEFVPSLPAEKLQLSQSTLLGDYCKVRSQCLISTMLTDQRLYTHSLSCSTRHPGGESTVCVDCHNPPKDRMQSRGIRALMPTAVSTFLHRASQVLIGFRHRLFFDLFCRGPTGTRMDAASTESA